MASLTITYQGTETVVAEGSTALIGSGDNADITIARPGISRRHLVASFDGAVWKLEDAGSRNGTYENGERIHVTTVNGATNLVLGHPTSGEQIEFRVNGAASDDVQADIDAFVLPDDIPAPVESPAPAATTRVAESVPAAAPPASRAATPSSAPVRSDELTAAIRDQISAIKGLTWSVWAMIAVTAALCVLTLFVGILGG